MELRDLGVKLLWCPSGEMQHSDGFSRNPIESAESYGPDPIDTKFHNNQEPSSSSPVNNIEEDDNDDDDYDLEEEVDDPLYSKLFRAASEHPGYGKAVEEFQKHEKVDWKNVPNGTYQKQLKGIWDKISISQNSKGEKLMVLENERFIVPPTAIPHVLDILDLTHTGFPKAYAFAKARYWFPDMKQLVEKKITKCLTCQVFSRRVAQEEHLGPEEWQEASEPFEVIYADEFSYKGKNYLIIVDDYSSYSKIYPITGRRTTAVLKKIIRNWCLDYGFCRLFCSDGARVWTSGEFQEFLKTNKIRFRVSSPMHAASSGRHEQKVGQFKSLMKKIEYEQELNEATLRERWEMINQMPSRTGELSPARLAFRRERRNPSMPILPQAGGEEERGKKQKEEKDKRREQTNARMTKRTKKPPIFVPGQRILTSKYSTGNEDNEKSVPGKVVRLRKNSRGRSAVIELSDGSTTVRNRRFCAIDPTEPQPDESVDNIEGDDGHTCIKIIQKKEEGNDEVYLENRIQKLKARGAMKVVHLKDIGGYHMIMVTNRTGPSSIVMTKEKSKVKKKRKVMFDLDDEEEENEEDGEDDDFTDSDEE